MSSAVGTFIADNEATISQVGISPADEFRSIRSVATTPTPPTLTPRERRRGIAKTRLMRNEAAILGQIEARLLTRLSTTS